MAIVGAISYVSYEGSPDTEARLFGGIWSLSLALLGLCGLFILFGRTIGRVTRRLGTQTLAYGALCGIAGFTCLLFSRFAPHIEGDQLEVVGAFMGVVGVFVAATSLMILNRTSPP